MGTELGGWLDNRRGEWWLLAQLILISARILPPGRIPSVLGLRAWPRPLELAGVLLLLSGIVMAAQAPCCPRQQPLPASTCRDDKPTDPERGTNAADTRCIRPCCCAPWVLCWSWAALFT